MFKAAAKSVGVGPAHWEAPKKKVDALEGEDANAASQDTGVCVSQSFTIYLLMFLIRVLEEVHHFQF
tara:strand:+ start:63 stop:263 length:201 start_codon:yes stop_codon:yes gene_type:complete